MAQLFWNGSDYEAEIENGVMYVNGDVWAEERLDRVIALLREENPHMDRQELRELAVSDDVQWAWDDATEYMLDASNWEENMTGVWVKENQNA